MSEQTPNRSTKQEHDTSSLLEKRISRRGAVVLGGITLATIGFESGRRYWAEDHQETIQDTEDAEIDVSIGRAEELRSIAETEGPDGLIELFQITKEQAPTPSVFADIFAERIRDWVMAGCTPGEADSHTVDTLADFQAEMNDKYSIPAILALGGNAVVNESEDGDPTTTSFYQEMETAHNQMLEHYVMNMAEDENEPVMGLEVLNYEMGTPDPYNNQFPLTVDLKYTVQGEASGLLTITGTLNLVLHTAGEVYEITLNDNNSGSAFKFIRE